MNPINPSFSQPLAPKFGKLTDKQKAMLGQSLLQKVQQEGQEYSKNLAGSYIEALYTTFALAIDRREILIGRKKKQEYEKQREQALAEVKTPQEAVKFLAMMDVDSSRIHGDKTVQRLADLANNDGEKKSIL